MQRTDSASRSTYPVGNEIQPAVSMDQSVTKTAFVSQNGSLVVHVQSLDASMYAYGVLISSYRDNGDYIWSQAVAEGIELEYEQNHSRSKAVLDRDLFVVIGSCVLNQREKNRQRYIEKNILEIPKVELKMTEGVAFEKKKTIRITVGFTSECDLALHYRLWR